MTDPRYAENIADAPDLETDPGPDETPEVADQARRLLDESRAAAESGDDDLWDLRGGD